MLSVFLQLGSVNREHRFAPFGCFLCRRRLYSSQSTHERVSAMRQLMIFGDSVMKGVIHENGKFRLCQDHDFSFLSKNAITGVNYAKMGATVKTGFAIMQRKLGLCTQDDTVLLSFGGNDCDYDWAQIAARPDDEHLPAVPPEAFCAGYRTLIETAQQSGARVAVASIIPLEAERYMQCISAGKNADHILKWLGDVNHLYRWQEYYNTMLCQLAQSLGCPIVDLRGAFLQRADFQTLISDDGIHPSQKGHDLIHQRVAAAATAM